MRQTVTAICHCSTIYGSTSASPAPPKIDDYKRSELIEVFWQQTVKQTLRMATNSEIYIDAEQSIHNPDTSELVTHEMQIIPDSAVYPIESEEAPTMLDDLDDISNSSSNNSPIASRFNEAGDDSGQWAVILLVNNYKSMFYNFSLWP